MIFEKYGSLAVLALLAPATATAFAQETEHDATDHSKMDHAAMGHGGMDGMAASAPAASAAGSGTARIPGNDETSHGIHLLNDNGWMVMLHGFANTVYTDQSGPRGDDKLYVQSMSMLMASKQTDWGKVEFKAMNSLEPLMSNRGYPSLFATGETNNGEPLVDRQHPHDFFMELSARVDVNLGGDTSAFLYGGPVGEPALGPSVFMHRGSATYNPEAPISHHWFDSTHITYGVVTGGIAAGEFQLESSAFRGREPDEERWGIETPKFDSWSVRATWNPSPSWSLQASTGRLESPEISHPEDDEQRTTASVHYANGSGLSAMGAYSHKNILSEDDSDAWLAEVNWNLNEHHTVFGRIENVLNRELFPDDDNPLHDQPFRISKFQAGYAYRLPVGPFGLAIGGTLSAFDKPDILDSVYGSSPMGYTVFARFSLGD